MKRTITGVAFLALAASVQTSAQTPAAPTSAMGKAFCQEIAKNASEANRGLSVENTYHARSAPFITSWLVQSVSVSASGGSPSVIGRTMACRYPSPSACDANLSGNINLPGLGSVYDINGESAYEAFDRWHDDVGMLPAGGEYLLVKAAGDYGIYRDGWSTGAFLKSVIGKQGLVCGFDNRVHEFYLRSNGETGCAALLSDGSTVLKANPVPADYLPRSDRPRETSVQGLVTADVDGDGVDEHLIELNFSPSSGNCGRTYYDVLDPADLHKFSSAPIRERVAEAQDTTNPEAASNCFRTTRLRKSGNRVLFEVSGLEPVEKRGEPIITKWSGPLERTLRDISGGEVRPLCSAVFGIEPVVRFPN